MKARAVVDGNAANARLTPIQIRSEARSRLTTALRKRYPRITEAEGTRRVVRYLERYDGIFDNDAAPASDDSRVLRSRAALHNVVAALAEAVTVVTEAKTFERKAKAHLGPPATGNVDIHILELEQFLSGLSDRSRAWIVAKVDGGQENVSWSLRYLLDRLCCAYGVPWSARPPLRRAPSEPWPYGTPTKIDVSLIWLATSTAVQRSRPGERFEDVLDREVAALKQCRVRNRRREGRRSERR
jgi:hypothetical protein